MIDWLKSEWTNLISNYSKNNLTNNLWNEIELQYSAKNRQYHNLSHIYNMLTQIEDFKTEIHDLDVLKFSVWYHDIIYKSSKKDNEEKSAFFSEKRLKSLNFDEKRTGKVKKLIVSTKKHEIILKENNDNAYLLDIDLSILGSNWETYNTYINAIREEYKIYPDFLYKPGRKKILSHFIERKTLYFTEIYQNKFEKQARENIKKEIELL